MPGKVLTPALPDEKPCSRCKEVKPASEFKVRNYITKGGNHSQKLHHFCHACRSEHDKEKYRKKRIGVAPKKLGAPKSPGGLTLNPQLPADKRCPGCSIVKSAAEFGIVNYTTDAGNRSRKLKTRCKSCGLIAARKRRNRPRIIHDISQPKQCNRCKVIKPADCYHFITYESGRKALASYCKQCLSEECKTDEYRAQRRAYEKKLRAEGRREKTPEAKQRAAEYYQQNKEQIRLRNKAFRDANPEIVRKRYLAAIYKKRTACDKRLKHIQDAVTEALESYRIGNMYWDVYSSELIGEPTVDHIVPLSSGGTNEASNLCVTSLANNSSKSNQPLLGWLIKRLKT